jgi:hypothetical protein
LADWHDTNKWWCVLVVVVALPLSDIGTGWPINGDTDAAQPVLVALNPISINPRALQVCLGVALLFRSRNGKCCAQACLNSQTLSDYRFAWEMAVDSDLPIAISIMLQNSVPKQVSSLALNSGGLPGLRHVEPGEEYIKGFDNHQNI